jgi:hypothetical protein
MRRLQLYIGTERVDLFKDESVSLTQTIQNVKDIAKVFTEFTQTFSVPASSVNNKIFKHYYNFDISGGFDARNKVAASLELNDLPFKTGLIALQGVDLKNNLAHTYKITFFGNTVNLKDILGADQLASLSDLNQYSLEYNYANVKAKLETGGGPLIAPLLTHTNRLFYDSSNTNIGANNLFYNSGSIYNGNGVLWSELKFAITLQAIIDAIQAKYTTENEYQSSIVFSDDFFNNTANVDFNYLFMWLHRKKGDVETTSAQGGFSWTPVPLTINTETGERILFVSNGSITIDGDFINGLGETKLSIIPVGTAPYSIRVLQDGAVYEQRANVTGPQLFFQTEEDTLPSGSYTLEIAADTTVNFAIGNISWRFEKYNSAPDTAGVALVDNAAVFNTDLQNQFTITEQIPKMKIIDFLTAIFKMFNLTAYVDDVGTIVVKTLDSYYAASTTVYNIDKYLDTTTSKVDIALPFKEIFFRFKGLGTILAEKYNQINNIEWGTEKYTPTNTQFTTPSESYKVEVPFEHMMFERLPDVDTFTNTEILYGVCIDDNSEPYIGEPLIFYREFTPFGPTQTPIALKETEASAPVEITTYNMPSNSWSLYPATSTSNINFSNEFNEYTLSTDFTGTLFNNYYLNYIKDVFNEKRRLTKVTAYLPMKVYYNLQLNDLIEIGQDSYKINSMKTDLTTGKTEFELLNTIL